MTSFSFKSVDDRSFPYLRGVNTFYDLLDERNSKNVNVSGLCAVSGHIAVLFHDSTSLCLFDAVPAPFRLSDVSSRLLVDIITKRKPLSANNLNDILFSTHSSPIVRVFFDKGPPLRLIAIQLDGLVFVWEWSANEWMWKISSKFNIYQATFTSVPPSPPKTIKDAFFLFGDNKECVVWLENSTNFFYIRNVQLPKLDLTSKKRLEDSQLFPTLQPSSLISSIPDSKGKFVVGKGGVWILGTNLYFYSLRFQKLVTIKLGQKYDDEPNSTPETNQTTKYTDDSPPVITEIVTATVHPDTQELLLLDPRGFLFACSPEKLTISFISSLSSPPPASSPFPSPSTSPQVYLTESTPKPSCIFAKHHLLFVIQDSLCKIYDIQSGVLMGALVVPLQDPEHIVHEWESSPGFLGNTVGIWSTDGIWEIKTPPALKQAEMLAPHASQKRVVEYEDGFPHYIETQTGGAAPLCHDWSLDKWEAKYLLDTTLATKSESVKREASKLLLPKLENPALILALLSSTESDDYLLQELRTFLDKYHGSSNDNDREKAKAAFLYHTPLNEKLIPLLDKFYKVSLDSFLPSKDAPVSIHYLLRNITPKELMKQDASTWEMLSRNFPDLFLAKIEEVMGLSKLEELLPGGINNLPAHFPVQRTLFDHEESLPPTHAAPAITHASPAHAHSPAHSASSATNPRKAAVFETMVKLYYLKKPHLLCFFVQVISRLFERISAMSPHSRNSWNETSVPKPPEFFTRALLALPPLPEGDISDTHLTCRFEILCASGNLADAVRLLLDFDRWEQALAFARQRMDQDVDHFVLFQIFLTHALKVRSTTKLNQIWEILPHGFGIFDLLSLVRHLLVEDSILGETTNDENRQVLAEEEEEILMVEVFRPQLLRMLNASKHGESI